MTRVRVRGGWAGRRSEAAGLGEGQGRWLGLGAEENGLGEGQRRLDWVG